MPFIIFMNPIDFKFIYKCILGLASRLDDRKSKFSAILILFGINKYGLSSHATYYTKRLLLQI